MADFSLNIKVNGAEQVVTTVGEIEAALRATNQELKNTAIGSEEFQRLSTQSQTLQREFVNSYKEATNFNRGIAELGQSVGSLASTVTAGFTIATSAFALFGEEGTAVTEAAAKAQQALGLALAVTTIATKAKTLTEDLGNVAAALGLNLTRAKTAATLVNTEATAANVVVTEASAVASGADAGAKTAEAAATTEAAAAQEGLNVAMSANPIGLVLAGLAALVTALVLFSDSEKTAKSTTAETNKVLLEQSDLLGQQSQQFLQVYKLRRELQILQIKDTKERTEAQAAFEKEFLDLQIGSLQKQNEFVSDANNKNIEDFKNYVDAYTGLREVLVSTTVEYDEFGVALGQRQNYVTESYKLGQADLDGLRKTLSDRNAEIDKSEKKGTYTIDEANLLREQAQTEYYINYLTLQKDFLSKSTKADDENLKKNLEDLLESFKQTRSALEKNYTEQLKLKQEAAKKEKDEEKKAADEAQKKLEADLERRRQEYKKKYDDIKKTVTDALKELNDIESKYKEEATKLTFKTKGEEVAFETKQEQEKLDKIRELRIKDVNDSVLKGKEKAKALDDINKQYEEANDALKTFYKDKQAQADAEDVKLAQDKANKILEIEKILQTEIGFGDQNAADLKETLYLRERQLQVEQMDFEMNLRQQAGLVGIQEFEQYQTKRLELVRQNLQQQRDLEIQTAEAEAARNLANFKENLAKEFGEEFLATDKAAQLIATYKTNSEQELNTKRKEINQKYRNEETAAEKKSADDILNYKLAQLQKYTQAFTNAANTVVGLASAITELQKVEADNQLRDLQDSIALQQSAVNEQYNADKAALEEKYANGLISQQAYNEGVKSLDKNLASSSKALQDKQKAEEYAAKKKAFEQDKKLKIAQAIISGISGAVSAFTGAFQLGPIAGPIVGGILAALVVATTAVQVAAISKTRFEEPSPTITAPNTGGGGGDGAGGAVTQASAGGFTGFNQGLVGAPTGTGAQFTPITGSQNQRVYVVESDITGSQNRVRTLESNATFG